MIGICTDSSSQLPPELRDRYGYPEITDELRAKIFGLNALKPYDISLDEATMRAGNDLVARGFAAAPLRVPGILTNRMAPRQVVGGRRPSPSSRRS